MAGVIIYSPDDELVGFSTGDTVAVNTYLDIQTDTLYYTDGTNIYEWEGAATQKVYTWKSGEFRTAMPVNMGAAIVEAEAYTGTVGDPYWDDTVFSSSWEGTVGATSDTEDARGVAATFVNSADLGSESALGSTSLKLNNSATDYVTYGSVQADYDAYQMASTSDFTIDGFFWLDNALSAEQEVTFVSSMEYPAATQNFTAYLYNNGPSYRLALYLGSIFPSTMNIPTPTLDTWYYFLIQRRYNGGSPQVDYYIGLASGETVPLVGTQSYSENPGTVDDVLKVGVSQVRTSGTLENYFDGYLDAIRVTKALRAGSTPDATVTVPTTYSTTQGASYDITFKLYADNVLKHTQTVTDGEPFRLPGGYLSNIYSVEIVSGLPVTRVSVAENIFELSEG